VNRFIPYRESFRQMFWCLKSKNILPFKAGYKFSNHGITVKSSLELGFELKK
jgi:hypothetical protein